MFASSFSQIIIVLVALFMSFSSAVNFSRKSSIIMGARGVQKLGRSVIETTIPPTIQGPESASQIFKRPLVGSGCDDRTILTPHDEDIKWATLSKIDKLLQQRTLLMGLEGSSWGTAEKLERVRSAVRVESLLPTSLSAETVLTSNLKSGGLLRDWDL
jgi:hypothetical protein